MAAYQLLKIKGDRFGLNNRTRREDLQPGEASLANNVEFRNYSISQRRGFTSVLTGGRDSVERGGPAGSSLYVVGDQYWLNNPGTKSDTSNTFRETSYNGREGLLVVPEGSSDEMRCNVQTGLPDFAFEVNLWSDDFNPRVFNLASGDYWKPTIVMAKGDNAKSQWAIRIIPEQGFGGVNGDMRFKVVLTLYESAVDTVGAGVPVNGTDFFFDDGGGNKSWFSPGKRHWFAWKFDDAAATITSYYWQEADVAVVSSSTAIPVGLRTNGTSTDDFPILIGSRAVLSESGGSESAEQGFNGVVSEMRWYKESGGSLTLPTFDTNWFLEREIPDEELGDVAGTWTGDTDVTRYFSFGQQYVIDTVFLDPRYTTGTAADNRVWLTGADANWVSTAGAAGNFGLQFIPKCPAASQEHTYYESVANVDQFGRYQNYGGGIRIPNGDKYMSRPQDISGGVPSEDPIWPEDFSFHTTAWVTTSSSNTDEQNIFNIYKVRAGSPNTWEYEVFKTFGLSARWDGANWKFRTIIRNSIGTVITTDSSVSLVDQQVYTVVITVSFRSDLRVRIYVDGVETGSTTALGSLPPSLSTDTNVDTTTPNEDGNDKRRYCIPMMFGYVARTDDTTVFRTWFGAPDSVGSKGVLGAGRRYWGFGNDAVPRTANSGVTFHGDEALRGGIGNATIWNKLLTAGEVETFAGRPPNQQEIAAYGPTCLSSWDMDEGKDSLLWDSGHLQNHLRVHPYPQTRSIPGPLRRRTKSTIEGFWEIRPRTPREQAVGREIYALAGGSVCRVVTDSSGDQYMERVGGRLIQSDEAIPPLPYAFQYSDYLYLCDGRSPPQRISRGKVSPAGISPVFGEFIQDDNLGWLENDRDGTFEISQEDAANAGETVFNGGVIYQYALTYFDPETAVESAPSRFMVWTVEDSTTFGAKEIHVGLFPIAQERNAIRYRLYRTVGTGGVFSFLDEVDRNTLFYVDVKPDIELGSALTTSLNFPPPQGARLAAVLGSRVIWAGVKGANATVFPSLQGKPEAVPPQYQQTVAEGRSSEITGLHTIQNRTLVFLQDSTFYITDTGADAGRGSLITAPIIMQPLWKNTGCVNQQTIVSIDGVGTVFVGERGIMVTDGNSFTYVSEKVEATFSIANKSTYRQWHAVHWRRSDQYRLYYRESDGAGENDRCLVWDYSRNAFSIHRDFGARFSAVIEDKDTGENQLLISDEFGQLWEHDSATGPVDSDGPERAGFDETQLTGLVQTGSTDTVIELVTDGSLPTGGDGLRGIRISIGGEFHHIISNTTNAVRLDPSDNFSFTPGTTRTWFLGAFTTRWRSGRYSLGSEFMDKRFQMVQLNPSTQVNGLAVVDCAVLLDDQPTQTFPNIALDRENVRFGDIKGRGRRIQVTIDSERPGNYWEIRSMEVTVQPRRRSKW